MRRDTPGTPDQDPQNSRTSATQVKRQAEGGLFLRRPV